MKLQYVGTVFGFILLMKGTVLYCQSEEVLYMYSTIEMQQSSKVKRY